MRPFVAYVVVFLVRNVAPIAAFGLVVYLLVGLLLPGVHPRAWAIITAACVALAILDRLKGKVS